MAQLRELEVIEVLIAQGAVIPCKRCRCAFVALDVTSGNIENEHLHEKGLGGSDKPFNRAFSHKDCHKRVTHGNGATFAGSSRHKVAKATDPDRIQKFVVLKPGPQPQAPTSVQPSPPGRCRSCGGQTGEDCTCAPLQKRSSFGHARRP